VSQSLAPGEANAKPRVTWRAVPGIDITPELRRHIDVVADLYFAKTKRPLEITSGYRSPRRQADAMYTKLAVGGSLALYKNQALTVPLTKAYREGRKKRWKRDRIVDAMAGVLEAQVAQGQYLSRHMRGLAFDIRSTGMTARQRQHLLAAIREVGQMRVILERRPPHFHVEIMKPKASNAAAPGAPDSAVQRGRTDPTRGSDGTDDNTPRPPEPQPDDEPSEIPDDAPTP
jgi:hypothetical protein